MKGIVLTDDAGKQELLQKGIYGLDLVFAYSMEEILEGKADTYFILSDNLSVDELLRIPVKPIFFNSVIKTLNQLNLPQNYCRINGWPTFINRKTWEVAGDEKIVSQTFDCFGLEYSIVPDTPGFISPRIVAMIINEAFFTLGEGISTAGEIDIAMKLGTNYPYGPFEWAKKIGLTKITELLNELAKEDNIYTPASSLLASLNS